MKTDHEKFMQSALAEARQALAANEFPVGCVFVHDGRVIARGRRTHSRPESANELDHAEITAIRDLVTNHPDLDRSQVIAYSTMEPCLMCFSTLLLNGIRTIVYAFEDAMGGGANLPLSELNPLYREMNVTLLPHVRRDESLRLFKEFFTNPENSYWKGSLLAEYILDQPLREKA